MNNILANRRGLEKIEPENILQMQSKNLSLSRLFNDSPDNISEFSGQIEELSIEFSSYKPSELSRFPTFAINDFFIVSESEALVLLYKNSSVLSYVNVNSTGFKLEATISEDSLETLVVDPHRKLAIVGCGLFENKIFIRDLVTLDELAIFPSSSRVCSMEVSFKSSFLISASEDGEIKKWDLNNLGKFAIVSNENYQLLTICSLHGWIGLATNYGKILYLAETKYEIKEPMRVKRIKASNSGTYLVVDLQKSLCIYKCQNSIAEKIIEKKFDYIIKDMAYNLDMLFIGLVDGTIIIWDHICNRLPLFLHLNKLQRLKVVNSEYLYLSTSQSAIYKMRYPAFPACYEAAFTSATSFSDDSKYFCYGVKRSLFGINLIYGDLHHFYTYEHDISRVNFVGSDLILIASKSYYNLLSISTRENTQIKNIDSEYINSIAYDYSMHVAYTAGTSKKIKIFSIDPFTLIRDFGEHSSSIVSLILFQNNTRLASRDIDGIRVWNLESFTEEFNIMEKGIQTFTMSKDDKYVLLAKSNKSVCIYDIEKENILSSIVFKSFCTGIYQMKDLDFLITSSSDEYLKFWDFSTLTCIFSLKVQGDVQFLKISEDENFIAYKLNLKSTNFYVIENPLKYKKMYPFGLKANFNSFIDYFVELKERKAQNYEPQYEEMIIMPYKMTILHIYAYLGQSSFIKSSLQNSAGLNRDSSGVTPLDLVLSMNHKNSCLTFIKYYIKNISKNSLLGNSISLENLLSINPLGFSILQDFYDSLLCSNTLSNFPSFCSTYTFLPKFAIHDEQIPDISWFFTSQISVGQVSIEFLSSKVKLNFETGSEESISFLQSLIVCPQPDIFRSKLIQYYIDEKWKMIRHLVNFECSFFIVYLILLCIIAVHNGNDALNVTFFLFGFILSLYEFLQLFGGIKEYFQNVWNYLDTARAIFLCMLAYEFQSGNYSSTLIVLHMLSWARGISYFRVVTRTRYMINLITEVLKDVFPFLIISAYSTIAFGYILMLMAYSTNDFFSFFTLSYFINLGNFSFPTYDAVQWTCFLIATVINPIVMMNLIIAIMGDTYDRVQEGKEVADYKEQASIILQLEMLYIFRRNLTTRKRLHVCKETDTKGTSKSWMGKVRELKIMIGSLRQGQSKLQETNTKILIDNSILKEQLNRVEKMLIGVKDKILDTDENSSYNILCNNGHKLIYDCFFYKASKCFKCKVNCENGHSCSICLYVLCHSCYKISYKEKLGKIDITCYRSHTLNWISDHSQYSNYDKAVFSCVGCKKKLYKNSYNCKICKWDICFKCVDIICNNIMTAWSKQCKECHSLEWNPRPHSVNYSCNICFQLFPRSGSFNCSLCDYDVCIRCFDDYLK